MKNLASERVRIGLSQKDLAQNIGVSRESVARWETGVSVPNVMTLLSLADLFECSLDYLLGRSDERIPANRSK